MSGQHAAGAGANGQEVQRNHRHPELLKLLSIKGCIVTIDAMGCQKAITQAIMGAEADYVLTLKSNHPPSAWTSRFVV